jgi:flagellar hook protein FlgE
VLRSLFSGISGLRAHQELMDVVSNNIANVNTTGFKSSSVTFQDTLSQLVRSAAAPGNGVGGMNPAQVGLGVQLGSITTNFTQGSSQSTGNATDLMIQGDGFFITRNGNTTNYTRAGALTFDTDGRLVTPDGMVVQGWMGTNGVVNTNGATQDVILPAGTTIPPVPSANVALGGNITAGTTSTLTLTQTAYDGQGIGHNLSITLTPDGSGGFGVEVFEPALDPNNSIGSDSLSFNPDGTYSAGGPVAVSLPDGTAVNIDLSMITSFGGSQSLAVLSADGSASGTLQKFTISQDGSIVGSFSNGQKLTLAKIALATFNNPDGLEKIGGTSYQATANSGIAQVGTPNSGSRGQLLANSLEMSNVDLAQEFTNLIIAQRGFEANSKVITTSDQLLQDLVDIKR